MRNIDWLNWQTGSMCLTIAMIWSCAGKMDGWKSQKGGRHMNQRSLYKNDWLWSSQI